MTTAQFSSDDNTSRLKSHKSCDAQRTDKILIINNDDIDLIADTPKKTHDSILGRQRMHHLKTGKEHSYGDDLQLSSYLQGFYWKITYIYIYIYIYYIYFNK